MPVRLMINEIAHSTKPIIWEVDSQYYLLTVLTVLTAGSAFGFLRAKRQVFTLSTADIPLPYSHTSAHDIYRGRGVYPNTLHPQFLRACLARAALPARYRPPSLLAHDPPHCDPALVTRANRKLKKAGPGPGPRNGRCLGAPIC